MKLKVVKQFKDKNDHKTIYQVGDVIDIKEMERVTNLIKRDLCVPIAEEYEPTASAQSVTAAEENPEAKRDEKPEAKEAKKPADGEKSKAGRSSRKPKKADEEVEEQPEEGDANPAPEEVAESEAQEAKEE